MAKSIDQQILEAESCIKRNLDQRRVEGFEVRGLLTWTLRKCNSQPDESRIEINDVDTGCNLITKVFELYPHYNIALYHADARGSFIQRTKNKRIDELYLLVEQLGYEIMPARDGSIHVNWLINEDARRRNGSAQ